MSEWNYVGAAYALTWLVFAGYSLVLAGRVRRARRRVGAMASYPGVGQ
jgi:membrane protein implicated in regulation of membrane protease activity